MAAQDSSMEEDIEEPSCSAGWGVKGEWSGAFQARCPGPGRKGLPAALWERRRFAWPPCLPSGELEALADRKLWTEPELLLFDDACFCIMTCRSQEEDGCRSYCGPIASLSLLLLLLFSLCQSEVKSLSSFSWQC